MPRKRFTPEQTPDCHSGVNILHPENLKYL